MTDPTSATAGHTPLWGIPRDRVWLRCPQCDGPAFAAGGRVSCAQCAFFADGATLAAWCACCRRFEGDNPSPRTERLLFTSLRCGTCGRRRAASQKVAPSQWPRPVVCHCGSRMEIIESSHAPILRFAEGIDPSFGLRYYLAKRCVGEILFAANRDHVEYLERFIGAKVRPGPQNEMGNRLPRWMLLAQHRDAVLTGLRQFRRQLDQLERR